MSTALYIGHGSPENAIQDNRYHGNLRKFSHDSETPSSIVVVSAHWERHIPLQITSSLNPGIIYDYYGFPQEMYEIEYPVLGNPVLAQKISDLLTTNNIENHLTPNRGLDHGAWVPIRIMYPNAEIPVIQISIPIPREPDFLFKIGQILQPLRNENVMMLGSGNLIHNLPHIFRQMQMGKIPMGFDASTPVEPWAHETDQWLKEKLDERDIPTLLQSPEKLPNFIHAAPTTEHFDPLYFTLGTLSTNEGVSFIHEGIDGGSISMRSFSSES